MTCTGTYIITEEDIAAGEVINHATVTASYFDKRECRWIPPDSMRQDQGQQTIYVSASDSVTVVYNPPPEPEIELKKKATPTYYFAAEEEISYSYEVSNMTTVPIPGPVTISDNLVENISCPPGDLGANKTITCTGTYTITEADVAAESVTNFATAKIGYLDASDSYTVKLMTPLTKEPELVLTLVKSADPTVYSKAGDLIKFTFEFTNDGDLELTAPFSVNDSLQLTDVSCPSDRLTVGATLSCTGWYTVTSEDEGQVVENCATVTGKYFDQDVVSNESCIEVFYQAPQDNDPDPDPEPQ